MADIESFLRDRALRRRRIVELVDPERPYAVTLIVHPRPDAPFARLTAREREVARLLACGRSNKEIAAELTLSLGTVKDHVHSILRKTGFRRRAEVAAAWR